MNEVMIHRVRYLANTESGPQEFGYSVAGGVFGMARAIMYAENAAELEGAEFVEVISLDSKRPETKEEWREVYG